MQTAIISKTVNACELYTPEEMKVMLIMHGSLDGVLKHKLERCRRKGSFLNEGSLGEFLVDTTDAKIINSDIWEQPEDIRCGEQHCFKLFIKMELSEQSRLNAKKL